MKLTKSKCLGSKYITYEKLKITISFGIQKIIYHNGSYSLLCGKRKLPIVRISSE